MRRGLDHRSQNTNIHRPLHSGFILYGSRDPVIPHRIPASVFNSSRTSRCVPRRSQMGFSYFVLLQEGDSPSAESSSSKSIFLFEPSFYHTAILSMDSKRAHPITFLGGIGLRLQPARLKSVEGSLRPHQASRGKLNHMCYPHPHLHINSDDPWRGGATQDVRHICRDLVVEGGVLETVAVVGNLALLNVSISGRVLSLLRMRLDVNQDHYSSHYSQQECFLWRWDRQQKA